MHGRRAYRPYTYRLSRAYLMRFGFATAAAFDLPAQIGTFSRYGLKRKPRRSTLTHSPESIPSSLPDPAAVRLLADVNRPAPGPGRHPTDGRAVKDRFLGEKPTLTGKLMSASPQL